jgi:hypothetical protein
MGALEQLEPIETASLHELAAFQPDRLRQTFASTMIACPTAESNSRARAGIRRSDYVTGTTLFVDGGMTLYPDCAEGG